MEVLFIYATLVSATLSGIDMQIFKSEIFVLSLTVVCSIQVSQVSTYINVMQVMQPCLFSTN